VGIKQRGIYIHLKCHLYKCRECTDCLRKTYLKNIDTKLTTILTHPIYTVETRVEDSSEKNLFTQLANFYGRIKLNQHNLEMVRVALAVLGIVPTSWQSTY
jgi:hypothetical protein